MKAIVETEESNVISVINKFKRTIFFCIQSNSSYLKAKFTIIIPKRISKIERKLSAIDDVLYFLRISHSILHDAYERI